MNVNMPARIDEGVHDDLKNVAKEAKESISILIARQMLAFVEGKVEIEKPTVHTVKKTSLSIHHDVAVAFKQKIEDLGIPLDYAIEQLAEKIVHTKH